MPRQFNEYDLRFEVKKNEKNPWLDCLVLNNDINKYTFDNSEVNRPWGPGIMLESVFYFLEYVGVRSITTIGFDVASSTGDYKHYYNHDKKKKVPKMLDISTYNYLRHISQLDYNPGHGPFNVKGFDEVDRIKAFLSYMNQWLLSKGVRLGIYTNSSFLSEYNFVKNF